MSLTENILTDRYGSVLQAGDFIMLEENIGMFIAGPYKYLGWRYETHVYEIGGMEFLTCTNLAAKSVKLNWKRWRNKQEHYDRFRLHWEKQRKGGSEANVGH